MAYQKQTFIDYPNDGYTVLKAEHLNKIQDAVYALDKALDSKVVEVERMHYGTNRFDKNRHKFIKKLYQSVDIGEDLRFSKATADTCCGGGWYDIPVTAGKTYTLSLSPITLSDYDNLKYGVFNALFFVNNVDVVVTNVHRTYNYYTYVNKDSQSEKLAQIRYNPEKVICYSYDYPGAGYMGMGTSSITFTVLDPSIERVHIQIGSWDIKAPLYQIDAAFATGRYLTDEEISQLENSFQINEGEKLLPYEEFNDHVYYEEVTESNLTKIQSAFTVATIPSSNLFDPVNFVLNHRYIGSVSLTESGAPAVSSHGPCCLFKIPVETKSYILHLNKTKTIGNKEFCNFGGYLFLDENDVVICGNYPFTGQGLAGQIVPDPQKAYLAGTGTNTLTFSVYDPTIKYLMFPILTTDQNAKTSHGLWNNDGFQNMDGLSEAEALELFSSVQLNDKGYNLLPYESFYDVSYKSIISPEYIQGLDTFLEDTNEKINEAIENIKISGVESPQMSALVQDNNFYIRAKCFEKDKDLVWKLKKVSGGNEYFNIENISTCKKETKDEYIDLSLTSWKSSGDDICPPLLQNMYIAANHGAPCVDKITHTAHGKTSADIGSVYTDNSSEKTYVITHIYNENQMGLVYFNDSMMETGSMTYGAPTEGTTLIHTRGGTNTNNIVVEKREGTQLWPGMNHYTIKLLVDGIERDLNELTTWEGNRFEVVTQYDVIFVPALLQYLMDNAGSAPQLNSDEIQENYMTMYINYQFNKNGSVSTYSSFYVPRQVYANYIGLVQSSRISDTPYTYIPDTKTYTTPVLHELSNINFPKTDWTSQEKAPYRFYQFSDDTYGKGVIQVYDRTIGWGENTKRLERLSHAGRYSDAAKMYTAFIAGVTLLPGTYFDGMAARVPLYKYDPDLTSVGWYWSGDDIHLMIDTHQAVNKDIVLPEYMNNMRIEVLDKTDSCTFEQTYIFNNKLRFISSGYGYLVLRLYK